MADREGYSGAPSVAPTDGAVRPISINPPAGAFGAETAAATQHLGDVISKSGNELWARALAIQQLDQRAEATNAVADFITKQGEASAQYRTLQGKAAIDGYKGYVDSVNNMREDVGSGLSSDYARKVYLEESRNQQAHFINAASTHLATQQKAYQIGTSEAKIAANANSVAMMPQSDEAYEAGLASNKMEVENLNSVGSMGWSPEQKDQYLLAKNSAMTYGRVTELAKTQPQQAKSLLDKAVKAGNISGADAGRAGDFIRNKNLQVGTRNESSSIMAGEGARFGQGKIALGDAREAIASNESGGNYDPPHPDVTHTVNGQTITEHALGRYGVMQSNLQPWLKEAGMPAMTEAEFLKNKQAQDDLFDFKFGQYQEKYGSANAAANMWFTGSPTPKASANDGHTSAPAYLQKFNAALARNASGEQVRGVAKARAQEVAPDDNEYSEALTSRALTLHNQNRSIEREDDYNNKQTVADALAPGPDGKLPTSIDEIKDPAVRDAYDRLKPTDRATFDRVLARNAQQDFTETPDNQKLYRGWLGKMINPERTPDDIKEITSQNFTDMALPWSQRQQLMKLQDQVYKGTVKNPNLGAALTALRPMMTQAGITSKNKDDYAEFTGALHQILEQKQQDLGRPLKDEEVRQIGAGLIREQSYPGTVFGKLWPSKEALYRVPVPDRDRQQIIEAYSNTMGVEPTESQISSAYATRQYNLLYGKTKAPATSNPPVSK